MKRASCWRARCEGIIFLREFGRQSLDSCGRFKRDPHAVATVHNDAIVGHLLREISRAAFYFLQHGGHITCEVAGSDITAYRSGLGTRQV